MVTTLLAVMSCQNRKHKKIKDIEFQLKLSYMQEIYISPSLHAGIHLK